MGWGPKDIHTHLIGDLLVVCLRGVLTAAEQQLAKSPPAVKACSTRSRTPSSNGRPCSAGPPGKCYGNAGGSILGNSPDSAPRNSTRSLPADATHDAARDQGPSPRDVVSDRRDGQASPASRACVLLVEDDRATRDNAPVTDGAEVGGGLQVEANVSRGHPMPSGSGAPVPFTARRRQARDSGGRRERRTGDAVTAALPAARDAVA